MGTWNPDMSFLTGDWIDDSRRKCILLKRRMNYDSFHIRQTYLWHRALRTASTSTDAITNWPANHLALASKVQIRYLRSVKEDSTVCSLPSLLLSEQCFAPNEKVSFALFYNIKKILGGNFKILHASWNSPLILPARLKRLGSGGVAEGKLSTAYEVISLIFIHLMMSKNVNWWLHSFQDDLNETFILK